MLTALILSSALFSAAPPDRLTAKDRDETIEAVLSDLRARYIDSATAERTAMEIEARKKAHRYDGAQTGQALADALTEDLHALAHDKHLGVIYSARPLSPTPLKKMPKLEGERLERARHRAEQDGYGIRKVERLPGNIGVLSLASLPPPEVAGEAAVSAMKLLGHTDALIVDLRGNGGGYPELVALYMGWLLPESIHLHDLVWRLWGTHAIYTPDYLPQGRWTGKEVYVLVDNDTISAGEQFAQNLREHCHAVVIGETTAGAANPTVGLVVRPHFANSVPMGKAVDPVTGGSWEGTGVVPDRKVKAASAFEVAHKLAVEALLARISDPDQREELQGEAKALSGVSAE